MNSIWIRHGECTDNVGIPSPALGVTPLTEKGQLQAEVFAAGLREAPSLIVHSPFVRTIQTAAPIRKRFPEVPVEVWDIQEITILGPHHYVNSSHLDRNEAALAYWQRACPEEIESEGAESFLALFDRIQTAVDRLQSYQLDRPILVVCHGHFMRGVYWRSLNPQTALDSAAMSSYTATFRDVHIPPTMPWRLDFPPGGVGYTFRPLEATKADTSDSGNEA
jgi:broad specificity phosphatase PhoE